MLELNNGNWYVFYKNRIIFAIKDGWNIGKHNASKLFAEKMLRYYEATYNE